MSDKNQVRGPWSEARDRKPAARASADEAAAGPRTTGHGQRTAPDFHAVILAGGRGTRFWPRSRRARAKQVLNVAGKQTLIQQTFGRTRALAPPAHTWVITNQHLREEIVRQLPELPADHIIAEPAQRNTAPAIGLAAHLVAHCSGRDAVFGVFPSDQVITREAAFRRVLRLAIVGAQQGKIVVLGIRPRWPETGYGYIEFARPGRRHGTVPGPRGLQPVAGFTEKPDLATARRYLRSGRYYWNSGMFVWAAGTFLDALARYLPRTAAVLEEIAGDFSALARLYPKCENISVDYAVMEKAGNVTGVPCDIGWNDVGSWNAVYELLPHDAAGNAARGEVFLLDAHNNYLDAADTPGKLIAAIGVDDLVVVDSRDALLIVPRSRAQDVSKVVQWLEKLKREELL